MGVHPGILAETLTFSVAVSPNVSVPEWSAGLSTVKSCGRTPLFVNVMSVPTGIGIGIGILVLTATGSADWGQPAQRLVQRLVQLLVQRLNWQKAT